MYKNKPTGGMGLDNVGLRDGCTVGAAAENYGQPEKDRRDFREFFCGLISFGTVLSRIA